MEPTRVLVVSGEDLTRVLAAIALSDAGYDVLEASSVSEALERLDDDAVDAVALDASLAETDRRAFESAYHLLAAGRVLLLLFNAQDASATAASASRAADPSRTVRLDELGQVIGQFLRRPAA